MVFASIYPLYLNRLEKNGKTKEELNQVIEWFTGFDQKAIQSLIDEKVTFGTFFKKAKNTSQRTLDQRSRLWLSH
jgi:hypothetical protein